MELTIDSEFQDKIPPLSPDEFSKLEENILADGEVREPLVVWHDTIIDGHHRWKIIQRHPGVPYKVKRMDFPDKWAAIVWMCRNQLGRRNITDEVKTVLIGEAYKAQKMTQGGERGTERDERGKFTASAQNEHLRQKTADIVAKDFGVGKETVKRAEHFVDGLNEAEKVSPGIKEEVLSGKVKAPKSVISEIRKIPEEERLQIIESIKRGEKVVDFAQARNQQRDAEYARIDDDARRHKAFITMVYGVLKFITSEEELEAVTDALIRSCHGALLESNLDDLDRAIALLTNIKNRLIEKGESYGKKK